MYKSISLVFIFMLLLSSCGETPEHSDVENDKKNELDTTNSIQIKEDIIKEKLKNVEIKGNIFNEYYPGTKKIKFQGPQDDHGERHGKWSYFSEDGKELSMTVYDHGKKHGHSIVKYPNGAIHYVGEYSDDKPVGVWKTYSVTGELTKEKDYGQPDDTAEN